MLKVLRSPRPPAALLLLPLALGASGCGGRHKSPMPPAAPAREALEVALTAWQQGQRVGAIKTASPPVQAVDSSWAKSQKLASYEVLEEVSRQDGRRCFKVRLHLQKPPRTEEVNYLVVGTSPLWVYRETDFGQAPHSWKGPK